MSRKEKRSRRWLRRSGYVVFFMMCFMLFLFLLFPSERLKSFIVQQVKVPGAGFGGTKPSGYEIEMEDLSVGMFGSLTMEGVRIKKAGADAALDLDSVIVRVGVLSALRSKRCGSLSASKGDGTLDIDVCQWTQERAKRKNSKSKASSDASRLDTLTNLEMEFEEFDLGESHVADMMALPVGLSGVINGDINIEHRPTPKDTQGYIDLEIARMAFGQKGREGDFLDMRVSAGDLTVDVPIRKGVANIKTFVSSGPKADVELRAKGNARFSSVLPRTNLRMMLKAKLNPKFAKKNDKSKMIYKGVTAGEGMFGSMTKAAKAKDGSLQYRVSGPVAAPQFMPSGSAKF